MTRWFVVVLAAGCAGPGGEGGKDDGDDDSDVPSAGGGLVWFDATGAEVPGVVYLGGVQPYYVDGNGHFWMLDPWTGTLDAAERVDVAFADPQCSVPWLQYVFGPPGIVMTPEDFSETQYFVAPVDAEFLDLDPAYGGGPEQCSEEFGSFRALPVASLIEVFPPPFPWTPPLHAELP